jgi:hypothetical protein
VPEDLQVEQRFVDVEDVEEPVEVAGVAAGRAATVMSAQWARASLGTQQVIEGPLDPVTDPSRVRVVR